MPIWVADNHGLGVRLALEVLEAVDRLLSHAELGLIPMSAIAAIGKGIKRRVCMLDAKRRGPSRRTASGREPSRPWPLRMHRRPSASCDSTNAICPIKSALRAGLPSRGPKGRARPEKQGLGEFIHFYLGRARHE